MLNASQAVIQQVSAHFVGNVSNGDALMLGDAPLDVADQKLQNLLGTYFLSNFSSPEFFAFTFSNDDFTLNPVYQFVVNMFEHQDEFHENSINLAKHLVGASQHPNIKAGDFYVARFSGINVAEQVVNAIGIFKAENKETYLKLKGTNGRFSLQADEGTNIRKLDKGCLILNMDQEAGFKICIVDNANAQEAQFWKQSFLNVKPWSDAFHHTQNFMSLTKQYVADQLEEEFSVSRADQIDLLNRSVNFFKNREQFDQREFETEVLADAEVIESFRKFGKQYAQNFNVDIEDNFEISAQAVKRQARVFKSVLKLDKNFHVYIHGNRDLIEKGFDEVMGKNYYKIYFDQES